MRVVMCPAVRLHTYRINIDKSIVVSKRTLKALERKMSLCVISHIVQMFLCYTHNFSNEILFKMTTYGGDEKTDVGHRKRAGRAEELSACFPS